jgi:hypothetical protein
MEGPSVRLSTNIGPPRAKIAVNQPIAIKPRHGNVRIADHMLIVSVSQDANFR